MVNEIMKTKYLLMAAMMLLGTMCFTACGDDDDDVEKAIENFENGKLKPTVTYKEGKDQLTLTADYKGVMTENHVAKFDAAGKLTSYIFSVTYASDKLADEAWKESQADPDDDVKFERNGRTITADYTSMYKDYFTYDMMKQFFQRLKTELESGEMIIK